MKVAIGNKNIVKKLLKFLYTTTDIEKCSFYGRHNVIISNY